MKEDSELEDGEIRDDVYEDISDCALSDILQEGKTLNCSNHKLNTVVTVSDFGEDNDVEQLRKEALKSLNQEDEINEEEIFRLEALKSLLKNTEFLHQNELTPESDDLTEEEQYRLEALKSLIMNTEFMPKKEVSEIKTSKKSEVITAVGRKRKKRKRKNNSNKHLRHDCDLPLPKKNSYLYETTSLLSGLSEDVKKINKTLESQKTEYVNKENTVKFELDDGSRSSLRSWYPKTEFTLLDISSVHNIKANHTVEEVKSEAEPILIEENNVKAVEMKKVKRVRFLDEVLAEQSALNEVKEENFIEFRQKPNDLLEKPKLLPIDSKPNVFKLNKVTLPSRKILSPKPPPNFCNFRKFETFPSAVSRKFVFQKKEKYKLNNIIKSRYSLRKTVPKIEKLKLVNNRSRYSLNRTNFPKIPPNEFLIPLENNSSTDDENVISDIIDSQVSSSVTPKTEELVVKVKEEPKDYDELNVPCATKIENSLKVDKILCVEPKIVQNEEISSMDNEKSEIVPLKKEIFNETNDKVELPVKDEKDLLLEAEENLIEIRSKLLLSLNELGTSIKTNADEKEKLNNMIKKLTVLKSTVKKLEEKIKTQKMKLAMSNSITRSHYEGVTLRSITCSKMKDLCTIAGMKIIGQHYRPPIEYETQLEEKKKTVDFSKCIPKFNENK